MPSRAHIPESPKTPTSWLHPGGPSVSPTTYPRYDMVTCLRIGDCSCHCCCHCARARTAPLRAAAPALPLRLEQRREHQPGVASARTGGLKIEDRQSAGDRRPTTNRPIDRPADRRRTAEGTDDVREIDPGIEQAEVMCMRRPSGEMWSNPAESWSKPAKFGGGPAPL